MLPIIKHKELLNADELAFIERRVLREKTQLYKIIRIVMVLCFLCPFAIAWYKAANGDEAAFSYLRYFSGVFFLMCFSSTILYLVYKSNLYKLQSDLKQHSKTIEQTHITRKQYMPQNHAYYFYLDSPNRLSIEVSEADFRRLDEGDEVNIEYTTNAGLYLGYF